MSLDFSRATEEYSGVIDLVAAFQQEWPDSADRPDLDQVTDFITAALAQLNGDTPDGVRSRQVATLAIAMVVMISSLGEQIRDLTKELEAVTEATRATFSSFADVIGDDVGAVEARLALVEHRVDEIVEAL